MINVKIEKNTKEKVYLLDKNKNIIKVWESAIIASKTLGIRRNGICRSCKTGMRCGGFYWEKVDNSLEGEIWKPIQIKGFEKSFASSFGRIKTRKGRIITGSINQYYLHVGLHYNEGKERKTFSVHELVISAFKGPRPQELVINHINGNKLDNRPDNLEYVTLSENANHALKTGLRKIKEFNSGRAVLQFDLEGNLIAKFESLKLVENQTGICNQTISECCRGINIHRSKYVWEYAEQ